MGRMINATGGLFGGALGTAFMQAGMKLDAKLPPSMRAPELGGDPADYMVKQGERIAGTRLPKDTHETVASSLHWAYGMSWGALLGFALPDRASLGTTMLAGAGMGAACWAAGYVGWLPATGLVAPIQRQGTSHALSALATHVIYGVLSAIPVYAFSRFFAPKRLLGFL